MQYKRLERSLPVVASVVASRLGINVVFQGNLTAATDGKTIVLPNLKAIGSEEDAIVLEGLLDHEAGHVRFTDNRWTAEANGRGEIFSSIRQIIEDARIEKELGRLYPGARRNLKRACEIMTKLGYFGEPTQHMHPAELVASAILYGLRSEVLGQDVFQEWAEKAKAFSAAYLGETAINQIMEIAKKGASLDGSSEQAYRATEEIINLLKKIKDGQSARADEQPAQAGGQDEAQAESEPKQPAQAGKAAGIAKAILEAGLGDIGSAGLSFERRIRFLGMLPTTDPNVMSESCRIHDAMPPSSVALDRLEAMLKSTRPQIAPLASKLDELLAAKGYVTTYPSRSGRLDPKRLAEAPTLGQVFSKRELGDEVNTAVYMLIDRSSSMSGAPYNMAVSAAVVFGLIAENYGVKVGASMFSDYIVKVNGFDKRWRDRCKWIPIAPIGGTLMAAAIYHGAAELAKDSSERKILFIVTDGSPRSDEEVRGAIWEVKGAYGFDVAVVLIDPPEGRKRFFSEECKTPIGVAYEPSEIPKAIYSSLSELLR